MHNPTATERGSMNLDEDIEIVKQQELSLVFEKFDEAVAAKLGHLAIELAISKTQSVIVSVRIAGSPVFLQALPGTAPVNFRWANRKANLVELYGKSSYLLGLNNQKTGSDLISVTGLSLNDYAAHGGSFPIRVSNIGLIGSVTVSGLPQREDHILVTTALAKFLNVSIQQLS